METPQLTSQHFLSPARSSALPGSTEALHALRVEIATLRAHIQGRDTLQQQQPSPSIAHRLEEILHAIDTMAGIGDLGTGHSDDGETLPRYSSRVADE